MTNAQSAESPSLFGQFFAKLLFTIKMLFFLVIMWAISFGVNSLMGSCIAIDYDGGIADTSKSLRTVRQEGRKPSLPDYWQRLNSMGGKDKAKLLPFLICLSAKAIGIKTYIICVRENEATGAILKAWNKVSSDIVFTPEPNDIYVFLDKKKPMAYLSSTDESLAQAIKAGIRPIRIKRKDKDDAPGSYNPGKYGEKVIPFTQI